MKTRLMMLGGVALCCAAMLVPAPVRAQSDSALLDALVKKGVLSDQEAEDIRADEEKDYASTAASKINLSSSIKTITFYGDLRLRYELRDGTTPAGLTGSLGAPSGPDSEDRNAWRYRLRFGFKGDLYDNWFYGVRFATNPYYNRSGNVTVGHSDGAGPFGKGYSLLAVDQVYLGWKPTPDITLEGGQIVQPLYTTSLVWDDNINPVGAAEQYDHTFDNGLEVFGTMGQYVYQAALGNGLSNAATNQSGQGTTGHENTFMFAEQAGIKYKFDDDTFLKAAATMYEYSGTDGEDATTVASLYSGSPLVLNGNGTTSAGNNSPSFFNGPFVGAASAPVTNVSGVNDLMIFELPAEFDFKAWGIPMRVFEDFAYNLEGQQRADDARQAILTGNTAGVTPGATGYSVADPTFQGVLTSGKSFLDDTAYQVGFEAGQLKKKGDWDTKVYWQSIGYYALDPNLIDADIFNAATNMQGVVLSASYMWTDGLTSTVRYAHADDVNGNLATPNVNQDLTLGDIKTYDLFQADLQWKF